MEDNEKGKLPKNRRWIYLAVFILANIAALSGVYWLSSNNDNLPTWIKPLVDGFGGNLTSGIVGSFLFLFLALYLDAQTEEKIDHIRKVAAKSEELISKRESLLESERLILQFEQFMKKESYHDVRLPDLKPTSESLGLEYTIMPVRDPKTGEPVKRETEMDTMYVVKVKGPAHWEVLDAKARKEYENSPIRDDEFYFCRFFNDSWHMSTESVMLPQPHRFYLSGKVGPVQFGQSANEFMESFTESPFKDMKKLATLLLVEDGTELVGPGGCTPHEIYQDAAGGLFLRAWRSLPKKMYYTNPPNTYDNTGWFFVIEGIRGYAHGQKLENMQNAILKKLTELKVTPSRTPWYNTDEHKYEPSV